ncbi:hypothetical protein StrepF001_16590 [Streptomyces sp. F001]|uniref:hypothetical protein n=1 Tax=Streptomyces sp. F001 TaxID=1510026 RepID=UPI00101E6F80|nr:hypothetical protein StrepF001_16590 [Streptomyces sp. F001]
MAASEGGHSLHLTFGVQTATGAQLLSWLADDLRRHEVLREDLPVNATGAAQVIYLERLRNEVTTALEDPELIGRYAAMRDEPTSPACGRVSGHVHKPLCSCNRRQAPSQRHHPPRIPR